MKKFLSSVLCLAMLLSMGTTAFATNISTDGGSQNVVVSYGMSQSFVVTIPGEVNFGMSDYTKVQLSAENIIIPHGTTLEVKVSGDDYVDKWELIDTVEASNKLTYTIGSDNFDTDDIVNNSVVLSVASGEAADSMVRKTIYFYLVDEVTKAGSYTDTLTFTVSVEDAVAEMISFTVAGSPYQAEKGMTWREWITANPELSATNTFVVGDGWIDAFAVGGVEYDDGDTVHPDDLIFENTAYIVRGM